MSKQDWLKMLIEAELSKILAEQEGPFGQHLWADDGMKVQYQDSYLRPKPKRIRKDDIKEPNTKAENEFYTAYMIHVGSDGGNKRSGLGKVINKFLRPALAQGLYTDFIAPPPGPLYRGMRLSAKEAAKILRLSEKEILEDRKQAWYVDGGGVIPAKANQVMSWTTKPDTAFEFAEQLAHDEVPVIFVAYPEQGGDFFLNPQNLLAKFDFGNIHGTVEDEMEVVSMGSCPFQEAAYYNSSDPDKMGKPTHDEVYNMAKKFANDILVAIKRDKVKDEASIKIFLDDLAGSIMTKAFKKYPFLKHLNDEQRAKIRGKLDDMLNAHKLPETLLKFGQGADIGFEGVVWVWEKYLQTIMGDMDQLAKRSSREGILEYEDVRDSLYHALAIKKKKNE